MKNAVVCFKVTEKQKQDLREFSQGYFMSVGKFIRFCISYTLKHGRDKLEKYKEKYR